MFTLTVLFESLLLFVNGLAILNEERFLTKSKPPNTLHVHMLKLISQLVGWGYRQDMEGISVKDKIITLLHAVRLLLRSMCLNY
jgi:hypothetical protein